MIFRLRHSGKSHFIDRFDTEAAPTPATTWRINDGAIFPLVKILRRFPFPTAAFVLMFFLADRFGTRPDDHVPLSFYLFFPPLGGLCVATLLSLRLTPVLAPTQPGTPPLRLDRKDHDAILTDAQTGSPLITFSLQGDVLSIALHTPTGRQLLEARPPPSQRGQEPIEITLAGSPIALLDLIKTPATLTVASAAPRHLHTTLCPALFPLYLIPRLFPRPPRK